MGVNIGRNTYNLSCDCCDTSKTIDYYDYDKMMEIESVKGWHKNYITGSCTCPECRKLQEKRLTQ